MAVWLALGCVCLTATHPGHTTQTATDAIQEREAGSLCTNTKAHKTQGATRHKTHKTQAHHTKEHRQDEQSGDEQSRDEQGNRDERATDRPFS